MQEISCSSVYGEQDIELILKTLKKKVEHQLKNPFQLPFLNYSFETLSSWKNNVSQLDSTSKLYGHRVDYLHDSSTIILNLFNRNEQIVSKAPVISRKVYGEPESSNLQLVDKIDGTTEIVYRDALLWRRIMKRCDSISEVLLNQLSINSDYSLNITLNPCSFNVLEQPTFQKYQLPLPKTHANQLTIFQSLNAIKESMVVQKKQKLNDYQDSYRKDHKIIESYNGVQYFQKETMRCTGCTDNSFQSSIFESLEYKQIEKSNERELSFECFDLEKEKKELLTFNSRDISFGLTQIPINYEQSCPQSTQFGQWMHPILNQGYTFSRPSKKNKKSIASYQIKSRKMPLIVNSQPLVFDQKKLHKFKVLQNKREVLKEQKRKKKLLGINYTDKFILPMELSTFKQNNLFTLSTNLKLRKLSLEKLKMNSTRMNCSYSQNNSQIISFKGECDSFIKREKVNILGLKRKIKQIMSELNLKLQPNLKSLKESLSENSLDIFIGLLHIFSEQQQYQEWFENINKLT